MGGRIGGLGQSAKSVWVLIAKGQWGDQPGPIQAPTAESTAELLVSALQQGRAGPAQGPERKRGPLAGAKGVVLSST